MVVSSSIQRVDFLIPGFNVTVVDALGDLSQNIVSILSLPSRSVPVLGAPGDDPRGIKEIEKLC